MSRARRLFKGIRELYEEYGVPLVNQIIDELGPEQAKKVRFPEKVRVEAQKRAAKPLAVRPQAPKPLAARPRASTPQVKALPPPDPSQQLPEFAVKPRGGQWYVPKRPTGEAAPEELAMYSPERVVRENNLLQFSSDPRDKALSDWFERALTKYVKTDMGTPEDPIYQLAQRGEAHIPDLDPEDWMNRARGATIQDPLGDVLLPSNPKGGMAGAGGVRGELRAGALTSMPWLAKQPVTDKLYGVAPGFFGRLELSHVADEMRNAMSPEAHGLPADLAVRPEMLQRMSFPQAVERVGRINQFRAKNMADASLAAMNNPAIQTFKEYPDAPYKWVEIRQPEGVIDENDANAFRALEDALRYEGDTMGHCVGGYCDDVLSGRARIFSLRDAKGEPHVTIETAPRRYYSMDDLPPEGADEVYDEALDILRQMDDPTHWDMDGDLSPAGRDAFRAQQQVQATKWFDRNKDAMGQEIIQIKGKQNRAPKDDYLPFVQDFVKSGSWSRVGDLANAQLVKLPDGRYVTNQQWGEGARNYLRTQNPDWEDDWLEQQLQTNYAPGGSALLRNNLWDNMSKYFEGFAVGGRVKGRDCSCDHFSVRR